jgi:hypothetical protein
MPMTLDKIVEETRKLRLLGKARLTGASKESKAARPKAFLLKNHWCARAKFSSGEVAKRRTGYWRERLG